MGMHQRLCVGNIQNPSETTCYSFALQNNCGENDPIMCGKVYVDGMENSQFYSDKFVKTDDVANKKIKQYLNDLLGTGGIYSITTYNCRHFSQETFDVLKSKYGAKK